MASSDYFCTLSFPPDRPNIWREQPSNTVWNPDMQGMCLFASNCCFESWFLPWHLDPAMFKWSASCRHGYSAWTWIQAIKQLLLVKQMTDRVSELPFNNNKKWCNTLEHHTSWTDSKVDAATPLSAVCRVQRSLPLIFKLCYIVPCRKISHW